jgi:hypothetical protein
MDKKLFEEFTEIEINIYKKIDKKIKEKKYHESYIKELKIGTEKEKIIRKKYNDRAKNYYNRMKKNPDFMKKRRIQAKKYYNKKKGKKTIEYLDSK